MNEIVETPESFWVDGLNIVVEQNNRLEVRSLNEEIFSEMWNWIGLNVKSEQVASVSEVMGLQVMQVCALNSHALQVRELNEQTAWNKGQFVAWSINHGLNIRVWSWVVSGKSSNSLVLIGQFNILKLTVIVRLWSIRQLELGIFVLTDLLIAADCLNAQKCQGDEYSANGIFIKLSLKISFV